MSDMSVMELLKQSILDTETGERLFDDARPDLYVSDVRNVIAEIRRLQAALQQAEAVLREARNLIDHHRPGDALDVIDDAISPDSHSD